LLFPNGIKFNAHGLIVLQKRTEESARRAVAYFDSQLEVNTAIAIETTTMTTTMAMLMVLPLQRAILLCTVKV
jgi:hypothetical protein